MSTASKQNMNQQSLKKTLINPYWLGGIVFTFVIASCGYLMTMLPGFRFIGQMGMAILLAVIYRNFFGYPNALKSGITFSSQRLLRVAIILYGLKLDINTVFKSGLSVIARDLGVIIFAMVAMLLLAKLLKAKHQLSLLLGVGTGVCGAAAIAAIAPIIKAKDEDTAISIGLIAFIGTIFAVVYTIVNPYLPLSSIEYGIWAGFSLHEIAHVVLATATAGDDALTMGLLAKLGRVFLLIPLSFCFLFIMRRKAKKEDGTIVTFPLFLIGFIVMSILNSFVFGKTVILSENFMNHVNTFTTWCLTAAMVGLGLNINLRELREKAAKPLLALTITSLLITIGTYWII